MTIASYFELNPVRPKKVAGGIDVANKGEAPDPLLVYGVELEIENVTQVLDNCVVPNITVTTDGSLRNNGYEFITTPMLYNSMMHTLISFFEKNKFNVDNYSERCSIHVHCNVGDLEQEQLATVLLTYICFERLLFRYVGGDRENNIFCVPIHQTSLVADMVHGDFKKAVYILDKARGWEKYTALNLLPMLSKGSIEFRHMPGTADIVKIQGWLRLLGHLFRYARTVPYETVVKSLMEMNTSSRYFNFLNEVFMDDASKLMYFGYESDMEDGVVGVKVALSESRRTKEPAKRGSYFIGGTITQEDYRRLVAAQQRVWPTDVGLAEAAQVNFTVEF